MLNIRDTQFAALAIAGERDFKRRAAEFLSEEIERRVEIDEIETLLRRGRSYGLRTEQDLMGYMVVAAASRIARRDDDPNWIREVMRNSTTPPEERVEALFQAAQQVWAYALAMR